MLQTFILLGVSGEFAFLGLTTELLQHLPGARHDQACSGPLSERDRALQNIQGGEKRPNLVYRMRAKVPEDKREQFQHPQASFSHSAPSDKREDTTQSYMASHRRGDQSSAWIRP